MAPEIRSNLLWILLLGLLVALPIACGADPNTGTDASPDSPSGDAPAEAATDALTGG